MHQAKLFAVSTQTKGKLRLLSAILGGGGRGGGITSEIGPMVFTKEIKPKPQSCAQPFSNYSFFYHIPLGCVEPRLK